jgi:hypothetical protein
VLWRDFHDHEAMVIRESDGDDNDDDWYF